MVIWREMAIIINMLGGHEGEAPWVSDIIEKMLEVFGLAGYVNNFNFTLHRRELLKPALQKEYELIAGDNYPPSPEWLFGDDLDTSVDKMAKENRLVEKLFTNTKPKKNSQGKKPHFNPKFGFHGSKKKNKLKFKTPLITSPRYHKTVNMGLPSTGRVRREENGLRTTPKG